MNKLSAAIITYNEEKNIERCIKSLLPVADEIVVLDSFSEDKTELICANLGVKFHQHAFDGHIQQKNRALTYTKYDWVLSLDADEALSSELRDSILRLKSASALSDAYAFNRLNYYCGIPLRHIWQPDINIRLWRKGAGQWEGKNPHDTFILKPEKTLTRLKGNLLHYSFETIEQHLNQINKFSSIAADDLFKKGKKPGLKLYFSPVTAFVKQYFLKAGFLDGYYGFVVAVNSAFAKFSKYSKLKAENKTNKSRRNHE
jgi:glycosyltransferase involved in cell wall biosynthesis